MDNLGPLMLVVGLVLFDLASLLWGADSADGPDSPEWERRRHWRGFGSLDERSG